MKSFPKVPTQYYTKPFSDCRKECDDRNLEVYKSVRAGSESVYVMRDKTTKEEKPGGFSSSDAAVRYTGK
jgi:hypothetical protein